MNKSIIFGCGTALITPFTKKGEVDYITYSNLVIRQIINGIDFLVVLGTTGESACLNFEEKIKLIKITIDVVEKKIPIYVGVGSNCTYDTIKIIKKLDNMPIDGYLVVTPYYNKPTQVGLYNHFQMIAENTQKSIIMYNIPARTGVNLSADTCIKLTEIKNIIAIKEASNNYIQVVDIIKRTNANNFAVLAGNDNEILSLIASGARGIISAVSNVIPQEMSILTNKLLKNDIKTAQKIFYQYIDFFNSCFLETNPIPIKAIMHEIGLIENILRTPLYPAHKDTISILKQDIKNLNLF